MSRALELAAEGTGQVSPNPLVGCVVVSDQGDIVSEGFYTYERVTHAEVLALEQAGERARGATAYVSLEPHHHRGRTRPCTEALIEAGIRRVVSPIQDPNPLVSGRGFTHLRQAGIEVTTGVLEDVATRLNEKFICWHKKGRPFIHLKLALSLDGRISLNNSVSTALSGEAARARVQQLRHEYDAILVGGNTIIADDPNLTDRSGSSRRRPLVRVILDNRLRLGLDHRVVATARQAPTIVFTNAADDQKIADLRALGVDVVATPLGGRDLLGALDALKERDIQSVLVEGGSEVAGAFIDARLVDKVTFIYSPIILGGREAPSAVAGQGTETVEKALRLDHLSVTQHGPDVEITGYPKE